MAIKTIFMCFLEDCEHHDEAPHRPYYMPKAMLKFAKATPIDIDQKA